MELFRLTLASIITRNVYVIFALAVLVLPWVLPFMTPWELRPQILGPAMAQTAWTLAWLTAIFWVLHQGTSFGHQTLRFGISEHFLATKGGKGRLRLLFEIWLACLVFLIAFTGLAVVVSLVVGWFTFQGTDMGGAWSATVLQYAVLFLLVFAPLLLLAVALGSRLDPIVAFVMVGGLVVYGLYGVGFLEYFLSANQSPIMDLLYVVSPHYHLADLNDRLVFLLGPLTAETFSKTVAYLVGWGVVHTCLSLSLYRATH